MGILKPYVYRNLREYGNTIISSKVYKRYGEEAILTDLKKHGLECQIFITKHEWEGDSLSTSKIIEHVLVEVVR
jgi:hypothetical protein